MTRFLSKVLKRWYVYLALLIILPLGATLYAKHALVTYESGAYILVQPSLAPGGSIPGNIYASPAQNGSDLMNEQLQSEQFMLGVVEHTDLAKQYDLSNRATAGTIISQVQKEITIAPAAVGQNAITLTVDDKSPQLAYQIATAVIAQFTNYYSQNQLTLDKQQEQNIKQQLLTLKAKINTDQTQVNQYEAAHPGSASSSQTTDPQLAALQQALAQDISQQTTLESKLNDLQNNDSTITTGASNVFQVQDAPQVPLGPTTSTKKLLLFTGGGLGGALVLILLIAGLETRADRKVYSSRDMQTISEALDMEGLPIESVPVLRGITQRSRGDDDHAAYSGVLMPVLTALPHLGAGEMNKELRRVAGISVNDEA